MICIRVIRAIRGTLPFSIQIQRTDWFFQLVRMLHGFLKLLFRKILSALFPLKSFFESIFSRFFVLLNFQNSFLE